MRILFVILMMFMILQGCESETNKTSKKVEVKNDVKIKRIRHRVTNGLYVIEYEGTKYLLYRDYDTGVAIVKHESLDQLKKELKNRNERWQKIMGD